MNTLRLIKQRNLNPALKIEGVVLTMYDSRSNLVQDVAEEVHKFFGKEVFNTKIPRSIRLAEAPSYGMPIMQFDPKSAGAIAYKKLTEELLERNDDNYEKITKDYLLRKKV
jgi:chromosome partitioning protein